MAGIGLLKLDRWAFFAPTSGSKMTWTSHGNSSGGKEVGNKMIAPSSLWKAIKKPCGLDADMLLCYTGICRELEAWQKGCCGKVNKQKLIPDKRDVTLLTWQLTDPAVISLMIRGGGNYLIVNHERGFGVF